VYHDDYDVPVLHDFIRFHHRLRGSTSTVLTATGQVNGI